MTFGRRDDRISLFGALRPSAGQVVTRAIVTTYSLDLVAMLGLVLTLGGDAEAEFEASPLGLVKAFDSMRCKLIVLHQLGRVVAPSAHRSVLPLLDTMVQAVASNERRELASEDRPCQIRGRGPRRVALLDRQPQSHWLDRSRRGADTRNVQGEGGAGRPGRRGSGRGPARRCAA